jgi:hypothetical protein
MDFAFISASCYQLKRFEDVLGLRVSGGRQAACLTIHRSVDPPSSSLSFHKNVGVGLDRGPVSTCSPGIWFSFTSK